MIGRADRGPRVVRLRCPAKVNLHLEVLGRRTDGYHEIRTIFAAVGAWDELVLTEASPGVLELVVVPEGSAPAGPANLVWRAAVALAAPEPPPGVHIELRKAIPTAGGLGGGSSDAAAALVGLAHLWGRGTSGEALAETAARLGSDVPFFLVGGVAFGTGRGTEVAPLPDLPPWWAVLLPGRAKTSTGEVYAALGTGAMDAGGSSEVYRWAMSGGELPLAACTNDLQLTVVRRWPEVGRRLELLRSTGPLMAMVAGSGGTVFALYESEGRAREVAGRFGGQEPVVVPLLSRASSRLQPLS